MHRITKLSFDRIIARRNGARWREHLANKSADTNQPASPVLWSRLWLRRRLNDSGHDRSNNANH